MGLDTMLTWLLVLARYRYRTTCRAQAQQRLPHPHPHPTTCPPHPTTQDCNDDKATLLPLVATRLKSQLTF